MQRLRSFALRDSTVGTGEYCNGSIEGVVGTATLGSGELLIWSEAASLHKAESLRGCFQRILQRNGFEIEDIDGGLSSLVVYSWNMLLRLLMLRSNILLCVWVLHQYCCAPQALH